METQYDRIETERVSQINCVQCGKQADVSHLPSFSSFTCPDCGAQQVVPAQFGSFILLGRLGSGGMGVIYHALDQELGRHVALKVMKKSLGDNPEFVESFKHEARAAAALNHRNVVQIYSFGQHQGQPYIVMELVNGGRLDEMIVEDQQLDEAHALEIHIEVAEGLKAASEVGLVHGDVKPANVLFGANGEAKVVDFGLASFIGQQHDESGQIWGTPYYIAPEKARRQKHDFRSDIYSLGATLFHALAGEPPFDGPTPLDVVLARFNNPAPDIMEFRDDLHPKTAALVARMLEATPTMRYPSYAALLYDMREALDEAGTPAQSGGKSRIIGAALPAGISGKRSSLKTFAVVLAALILAAGGIAGHMRYRNHKARIAAEAAEKDSFEKAKIHGSKAFAAMAAVQSAISENADKAKERLGKLNSIAAKTQEAKDLDAAASNEVEKVQRALSGASEIMNKASDARYGLEVASDSRAAFGIINGLELLTESLREHLRATDNALAALDQALDAASKLEEKARLAADAEREKKKKEQELARQQEAKKKAEEEARRQAQLEKEKSEQIRRATIQRELDMLDEARGANASMIAERKFDEAAASFELLKSKLSTPESLEAHKNILDSYDAMGKLKRYLVAAIGRSPYPRGWQLGEHKRDIVQADLSEGLKIALGDVGATIIPWAQVSLPYMLQITRYYVDTTQLAGREKAAILLSLALLCYESGDFQRAKTLAEMTRRTDPELKKDVDRLMPNLLSEEAAQ